MKLRWLQPKRQPQSIEKIIIGLGNPGPEYAGSRHNMGFMCLSSLAKDIKTSFDQKDGLARTARGAIGTVPVLLARPQTYMNQSGKAVSKLMAKYNLSSADLIVIHDDLDLRLGQIRIKQGGGSGGHRGVDSIISYLGKPDFIRVRFGVGRPATLNQREKQEAVIDFVLEEFSESERVVVADAIPHAVNAVKAIITEGLETAMNIFNRTQHSPTEHILKKEAP